MRFPLLPLYRNFRPRKRLGEDPRLRPREKDLLDALDVVDQRSRWSMLLGAVAGHWLMIITIAVAILVVVVGLLLFTVGDRARDILRAWVPWLP